MTKHVETRRNRAHDRSVLQHALINGEFGVAYQSIFDLSSMSIFAREALLRPTSASFPTPRDMLRVALSEGRIGELGRLVRRLATRGSEGRRLFLNAHPTELEPRSLTPDDSIFDHRSGVTLEFVPRGPDGELAVSLSILESLRVRGIALAFDDYGGPRSNVRDLLEIAPHVVKLDPDVIRIAATSGRGLRFLNGLVRLALDVGATVIAKGVESVAELEIVRNLGIRFAQGNALAPPSPIESIDLSRS